MEASASVGGIELDLEAFEGPLDLLLTLVLREELALAEVDLAEVVIAFVAVLDASDRLDLDACGEFLVLISALLELKARGLFDDGNALEELDPDQAADELARRLAAYRRVKEAAAWLGERLAASEDRFFRLGPPPCLPPQASSEPEREDPSRLVRALAALAADPPAPSTAHMGRPFPPLAAFLERWRALLRRRRRLDFDQEVAGFSRIEIAVAFLALLELRKRRELELSQASPFAPIRITGPSVERMPA